MPTAAPLWFHQLLFGPDLLGVLTGLPELEMAGMNTAKCILRCQRVQGGGTPSQINGS